MRTIPASVCAVFMLAVVIDRATAQLDALATDGQTRALSIENEDIDDLLPIPDELVQIGTRTTASVRLGQGIVIRDGEPILSAGTLIAHTEPVKHAVLEQSVIFISGESLISSDSSLRVSAGFRSFFGDAQFNVNSAQSREQLARSLFVSIDLIDSVETIDPLGLSETAIAQLAKLTGTSHYRALSATYGLGYIAALHRGSRVLIRAEMKVADETTRNELMTEINARFLGAGLDAGVKSESAQARVIKETMFSIHIVAGASEGTNSSLIVGWRA